MRFSIYILACLMCSLLAGQGQQPQSFSVPPDQVALSNRIRELLDTTGIPATKTTATATAATTVATASALGDHKLVAGDKVNFRILEDREPAKSLTVTDSGELDVPYIGLVSVKGKSCQELEPELKKLLEQEYYYRATVKIGLDAVSKVLGRIYIWGQVHQQGAIEIPANEVFTAGKAILRAGGFGEFAKKSAIKVIRSGPNGKQTYELNMVDILEKGKTEKDVPLEPDDLIIVPQRIWNF
jgi:polysaccharide export outer membrane protein